MTVDMLSTGVDIPKIENIVFLRSVKSRILFEQMMGRGTRLCPEINKIILLYLIALMEHCLPISAGLQVFQQKPPIKPTRPIREIVHDIANNVDAAL